MNPNFDRARQPIRLGQRVFGKGVFATVTSIRPGVFGTVRVLTDGGRTVRGPASQFSVVEQHLGRA